MSNLAVVLTKQDQKRNEKPQRSKNHTKLGKRIRGASVRVLLNPWFGEPVFCTLDSRGFRHFRGFRDFRESSTQLPMFAAV